MLRPLVVLFPFSKDRKARGRSTIISGSGGQADAIGIIGIAGENRMREPATVQSGDKGGPRKFEFESTSQRARRVKCSVHSTSRAWIERTDRGRREGEGGRLVGKSTSTVIACSELSRIYYRHAIEDRPVRGSPFSTRVLRIDRSTDRWDDAQSALSCERERERDNPRVISKITERERERDRC